MLSRLKMIKAVDAVVINDEEAKLLTKEHNLIKCAKKIMNWGVKYVVKKAIPPSHEGKCDGITLENFLA